VITTVCWYYLGLLSRLPYPPRAGRAYRDILIESSTRRRMVSTQRRMHRPTPPLGRQFFRGVSLHFDVDSFRYIIMLKFSADTFAKNLPGIQDRIACAGAANERDCRVNDNGVQNAHGVWWIPGGSAGSTPPPSFWGRRCAPAPVAMGARNPAFHDSCP
jgi:hypothetical protein